MDHLIKYEMVVLVACRDGGAQICDTCACGALKCCSERTKKHSSLLPFSNRT